MVRPQNEIILNRELTDQIGIDILKARGLWAVLYKNEPINLRTRYWSHRGELKKYVRTTYPNQAPADNLAKKLNKEFFTEEFTVKKII